MKSLIHTNPKTNETRWCVADVVADLPVETYIQAVDLGFRDDESHKPENFQWAEQPKGVSMRTHEYRDGTFTEKPPVGIPPQPNTGPLIPPVVPQS